jgi:hypothetical protein
MHIIIYHNFIAYVFVSQFHPMSLLLSPSTHTNTHITHIYLSGKKRFDYTAGELLAHKQADWRYIPEEMSEFKYEPSSNQPFDSQYNYGSGDGGWPVHRHNISSYYGDIYMANSINDNHMKNNNNNNNKKKKKASVSPPLLFSDEDEKNGKEKEEEMIEFPGWSKGRCDIAELDGKKVIENPKMFVKHFVVKNRPVILRDFIRHDKKVF